MGVQFFGGKFYKCVDELGELLPLEVSFVPIRLSTNVIAEILESVFFLGRQ